MDVIKIEHMFCLSEIKQCQLCWKIHWACSVLNVMESIPSFLSCKHIIFCLKVILCVVFHLNMIDHPSSSVQMYRYLRRGGKPQGKRSSSRKGHICASDNTNSSLTPWLEPNQLFPILKKKKQ